MSKSDEKRKNMKRQNILICSVILLAINFPVKSATISASINGSYSSAIINRYPSGEYMRTYSLIGAQLTVDNDSQIGCLSLSSNIELNLTAGYIPMTSSSRGWVIPNTPISFVFAPGAILLRGNLVNTCEYSVQVTAILVTDYLGTFQESATVPAAQICSFTLPDTVNLGSFTVGDILNGASSDRKINISGQCGSNATLLFQGNATSDNDFLLGDDVRMQLSYNDGANQIVNGQPFTPVANQVIDINLLPLNSNTSPASGAKTSSIIVKIGVP